MSTRSAQTGVLYGVAAYLAWGLFPVYFKVVRHVAPAEVLGHRVIWSAAFLVGLMWMRGRWYELAQGLRDRRVLATLLASTLLIALNWFTFIVAISTGRVLQASLGYFINPLVNVLLGYVFLGERLRRVQKVSVLLAGSGVLVMTLGLRQTPLIALVLAVTFGLYGLLRKTVRVEAMAGLTVETVLLAPAALIYLLYLSAHGRLAFGTASRGTDILLLAAGVITAVPLLWFTNAARRLRLSTLGFLQYLAPTGQFFLAVLVYSEHFTIVHAVTFAFIWTALVLYSVDAIRHKRP